MKQDKFIELLNLYLDSEISLEDAAKLEQEIQSNPQRREIYRQYCRMQKGCAMLAANFTSTQPAATFARDVVKPNRGYAGWYAGAAALAAACLAVVMVVQSDEQALVPEQGLAQAGETPVVASVEVPESKAASRLALPVFPENNTKLQTVFTPRLINTPDTAESARAFFARETSAEGFDWMERVRLDPLETGEMEFRVEPTLEPKTRTYRSRRPIDGQVEMTAFQFQR